MKGFLFIFLSITNSWGDLVINEIFYNAPDDLKLEFIELYHSGTEPAEVSGWTLADEKGTLYTFPDKSSLAPGSFTVVSSEPALFEESYGFPPAGTMAHRLGNGGDTVMLQDATGKVIENVTYDDTLPWPVIADGMSASLERLCPSAASGLVSSWAPSLTSTHAHTTPGGTPGKANTSATPTEPPRVLTVSDTPTRVDLGQTLPLRVDIDPDGPAVSQIDVVSTFVTGSGISEERRHSMKGKGTTYQATLPAATAEGIIRFAYILTGQDGAVRRVPHAHALRPMFSVYARDPIKVGTIPAVTFLFPEKDVTAPQRYFRGPQADYPAQGSDAVVITDEETKKTILFDFIHITPRSQGYKVRLHKDRLWRNMSTINVLTIFAMRHSLCESLAFELHRRAGVPASWADYFQLQIDGRARGIHLAFEQPNKAFLRRHGLDDDGNLYKAIWQGNHQPSARAYPNQRGRSPIVIGRHEKKTNVHEDYQDLIDLTESLKMGKPLDPPEAIIHYFAANALLSYWDGFHNNYFLYHEVSKDTDKWWMFPWDQDKTWGFHDGIHDDTVFSDLPLEAGMQGYLPPGIQGPDDQYFHAIGLPGAPWYRYGGEISRPVLAHPETRILFLKRIRELATTVFTEEAFGPEIDRLEKRLLPEANPRLQPEIKKTLALFRTYLRERRQFVLRQPEIRALP